MYLEERVKGRRDEAGLHEVQHLGAEDAGAGPQALHLRGQVRQLALDCKANEKTGATTSSVLVFKF